MIKVIVKQPNHHPEIVEINPTLKTFQTLVGGRIEYVPVDACGLGFYCNEEGKIAGGFKPNFAIETIGGLHDVVFGTTVFIAQENYNERSLTKAEINYLLRWIRQSENLYKKTLKEAFI